MNCHEFEDNIAAYMDGFLDGNLKIAMDEHCGECPECASLVKAHSFVMKSLDTAEPVKAPKGLENRILAAVEAYEAESGKTIRFYPRYCIIAAAVAAASSLIAAFIPLSWLIIKHIPNIYSSMNRLNTIKDYLNTVNVYLNTIKAQTAMVPAELHNWFTDLPSYEFMRRTMSLAVEPIQVPMLSFSIPTYYIAALVVLSLTAWKYFSDSGFSEVLSHS